MITNTTAKSTYVIIEDVVEYPIGFSFNYNPDGTPQLKVYINKLSETPLVYSTDYTISQDGLSIVLHDGYEVGDRIDIIRDIPLVQLSDYNIGRIDPEQIENDFDEAVMRDQALKADIMFLGEVPLDHESRIQELERNVDDIEALIPNQASTSNQLADKNFVNSSIATATAVFRGTYSTLAELEAVQNADLNDYGFIEFVDSSGNTKYSRYKYNGTSWLYEYTLNNSSFTAAQWAAINSGVTSEMVAAYHTTTGRNVGDVFFTMRSDNGLAGAVECNGAQYNTTDFTGATSIGALLQAGKVPYVSLAQYATLLSTNGSVGVFGWDGTGTTVFKVPSLNDVFVESGTAAQIGDYLAPGAPNITGTFKADAYEIATSGAFSASGGDNWPEWDNWAAVGRTFSFDASASSSVYGNSNTIQPNAIRYRAMVQLAVAATDEALLVCTEVTAQVAANTTAINGADYVIESQVPTAENNYTWYRKYKSGWVEQGGLCSGTAEDNPVTMPIEMSDTEYQILAISEPTDSVNGWGWIVVSRNTKTTTGFSLGGRQGSGSALPIRTHWQVSGIAAE